MENNNKSSNKASKRLSWKSVMPIVLVSTAVSSGVSAGIAYAFAKGFAYDVPKFTATFVNYDDSVLATVKDVQLGERVIVPEEAKNPTRPSHVKGEWMTWTFTGWDNDIESGLLKNMTFKAQYSGVHDKYTAIFMDGISTNPIGKYENLEKGKDPSQEIQAEMAEKCTKESTSDTQYTFSGFATEQEQGDDVITYTATYDETHKGLNFGITSDKKVVITSFNTSVAGTTDIEIPATWGDMPVTEIADGAFSPQSANDISITSVKIPSSIVRIGSKAFQNCTSLKNVEFLNPDESTLDIIQKNTFDNTGLTTVTLPNSVTTINDQAFANCENLEEVNFGANTQNISASSLENCPKLNHIDVESDIYSTVEDGKVLLKSTGVAGKYCIVKCIPSIESVDFSKFGSSITELSDYAFEGCVAIQTIDLSSCTALETLGIGCFRNCPKLETVVISDNISKLPKYCLADCPKLKSITFGKKIGWGNSIDPTTFDNDTELTEIIVAENHPSLFTFDGILYDKDEGGNATTLLRCPPNKTMTQEKWNLIPATVKNIGAYSFKWNITPSFVIPDQIETIGENAFEGCKYLTYFSTGNGVEQIQAEALKSCINLETLFLGKNIIYSADSMNPSFLDDCIKINKFMVDESHPSLAIMGEGILCNKDLTHIYKVPPAYAIGTKIFTLPEDVEVIDAWAFKDVNVNRIVLNDKIRYIDTQAFDTKYLTEIEIKNKAPWFFEGNSEWVSCFSGANVDNLKFIINNPSLYAESMSTQGGEFYELWRLNKALNLDQTKEVNKLNIQFASSEEDGSIDNMTFRNCQYLTSISFANNVKSVGEFMFLSCPNLTHLVLPPNLETSGQQAFGNCSKLTGEITIPSSLKKVPHGFFANERWEKITFEEGVEEIGTHSITQNTLLWYVRIPVSMKLIGGNAFNVCTALRKINYAGTSEQWKALQKDGDPFAGCTNLVAYCEGDQEEVWIKH